jgi:hypothetical protein
MTTIPCITDQTTWVGIDIAKRHNDVLIERPRQRRQHFKVANQAEDLHLLRGRASHVPSSSP